MANKARSGQVTVEVAVLMSVTVAAIVGMAVYLQRGIQGGMKSNADSLGTQFSVTDGWKQTTTTKQGTTENRTTITTDQDQTANYNQSLR